MSTLFRTPQQPTARRRHVVRGVLGGWAIIFSSAFQQYFLLMETGDHLLLETGDKIILDRQ
jgi:hypothetical protein